MAFSLSLSLSLSPLLVKRINRARALTESYGGEDDEYLILPRVRERMQRAEFIACERGAERPL